MENIRNLWAQLWYVRLLKYVLLNTIDRLLKRVVCACTRMRACVHVYHHRMTVFPLSWLSVLKRALHIPFFENHHSKLMPFCSVSQYPFPSQPSWSSFQPTHLTKMFLAKSDSSSSSTILLSLSWISGTLDQLLLEMQAPLASIGSFYFFCWFYFLYLPHHCGHFLFVYLFVFLLFFWLWSLILCFYLSI